MIEHEIRMRQYKISNHAQHYLLSNIEAGKKLISIAEKYDLHQGEVYKTFATTVGDIILGFYKIEDTVPLLQQELGLDPRTAALLGADVLDFLTPLSDPTWQPPVEEVEEEEEDVYTTESNEMSGVPEVNDFSSGDSAPIQTSSASIEIHNNQPHHVPFTPYPSVQPAAGPLESGATDPHQVNPAATYTPDPSRQGYQTLNPNLHTMATDMQSVRQSAAQPAPSLNLEHTPTYVSQNQDSLRQPLSNIPSYTPAPHLTTPPLADIEPPRWSSD